MSSVATLRKVRTVRPETGEDIVAVQAVHQGVVMLTLQEHPADPEGWLTQPIRRPERRRMQRALQVFTDGVLSC